MAISKVDNAINNKHKSLDYVHKILMPNGREKWFQAMIKIQYDNNDKNSIARRLTVSRRKPGARRPRSLEAIRLKR